MNNDDPIRVISKIRNNRLMAVRESMGITSREFADKIGIGYASYLHYESLRDYPTEKMARKIAEATGFDIDFLFPGYLKMISKNVAVTSVSEPAMVQLEALAKRNLIADAGVKDAEEKLEFEEASEQIKNILKTLTPRQEQVIIMRFGLDGAGERTLEEVAERFSVSRERIRQIEARAFRLLEHPSRKSRLKDAFEVVKRKM